MDDAQLLQRFAKEFARGTVLFREGDPGHEMYVVQEGRVTISKRIGDVETILSTLGQGEFFGEMSILCQRPRSATATVAEDARLLVIDARTFEGMVRSSAEIALRMIRKLAERLQAADDQISSLVLRDASSRVVHYIVTSAERTARGAAAVKVAVRRSDLAGLVGVEARQVDEIFDKLLRAQLVRIDGESVEVPDVPKLRHFLNFLLLRSQFEDAA